VKVAFDKKKQVFEHNEKNWQIFVDETKTMMQM